METATEVERLGPGRDFGRLWLATAISQAGSAVAYGALPMVAVLVLHASTFQVSLLTALAGITAALLGLRLGPWVEFRPKRPTMMTADLVRAVVLGSVPVAAALGVLTYPHLVLAAMVSATAEIAFNAASGTFLKSIVGEGARLTAAGRLETTSWLALSVGPPIGGALASALGPTLTVLVDAISYAGSALGVRSISTPEPAPPQAPTAGARMADITAGWRAILAHPGLRSLFLNALVFSAGVIAVSPLVTVLMLRDLGLAPWLYGIAMGLPCLGGVLGALAAPRLSRRLGERRLLLVFGSLRTIWIVMIPAASGGLATFAVVTAANLGLLFCAGVFNPAFFAYRLRESPDDVTSRVLAAWSVTTRTAIPLGTLAAGALAALTSARTGIAISGGVLLLSCVLLPWRCHRGPRE